MKFAQILNKKAHWIFDAEEKPQFAPDIILIDITGDKYVKEGWDYDAEKDIFIEPPEAVVPAQEPSMEEYLIDLDFRLSNIELGLYR